MKIETIAVHAGYKPDPVIKRLCRPFTKPWPTRLTAPSMVRIYLT